MAWTLGGNRFYVQEINGEGSQIIPRLQPLDGGTVIQFFGYENEIRSVSALVVGDTKRDTFIAYKKSSTLRALVSPEGAMGNYYVKKVTWKREPIVCQTIDTSLPEEAPVYTMDFELYPESDI
jgi:hypothetical protein